MTRRLIGFGALLWLTLGATAVAQDAVPTPTAAARAQGPLFAITYSAGPAWRPNVPMAEQGLREHFFYVRDLHRRGVIVLAGPRGDDGGLILLHAADLAAAEAIMADDPAVTAGLFVGEVRPFAPRFTSDKPLSAAAP